MITKTKQWGNSLAVIIPKDKADELKLKPNQEIIINIDKNANILKEMFGSIKFSKSAEELLKDARKNISKWD